MGGSQGTDKLQVIVDLVVEGANVASVLMNGGSVFSLTRLIDEVTALKGLDFEAVKKQASELDEADLASVLAAVKAKLELHNKALEARIESEGAKAVMDLFHMGVKVYEYVQSGKALYEELKALVRPL